MTEPRPKPIVRKRLPWGWIVLGALGLIAILLTWIQRHAPMVLAVTKPTVLKAGARNPVYAASGYLVARHRATLSSKVLGRVAWLGVEEGSRVVKGQILARLEATDL